jgi:hypothetical protein
MPFRPTSQQKKTAKPSSSRLRKRPKATTGRPRPSSGSGRGSGGTPAPPVDPMTQPYDPTVSQYGTNQDFENAVGANARSQIQPGLDDVNAQERAMQSASDRRMQELRGWYDWAYQGNSAAATQAQNALTQAAAAQAAGGQESQDTLAAALKASQDTQAGLVRNLGGQATDTGQDAQLLAGNQQYAGALQAAANANASTYANKLQGDLYGLQLKGIESGKAEQSRRAGLESGFANQRTDLSNRLPDLQTQSRQQMQELEAARVQLGESVANRKFQEWLSQQQLGLTKQNQTFQQWLAGQQLDISNRSQAESERQGASARSIARGQFQLDSAKTAAEIAHMGDQAKQTGDKTKIEQAKARGERMRNAATMINEWLKPTEAEQSTSNIDGVKKTAVDQKAYQDRMKNGFDEVLQQIRSQGGLGPIDSLRLLRNSLPSNPVFNRWRQRADRLLMGHGRNDQKSNRPTSVAGRPHG